MLKMKYIAALLTAAMLMLPLASCGNGSSTDTKSDETTAQDMSALVLDVSKAAADVAAATKFDAEMVDLDQDVIAMMYADIKSFDEIGVTAAGGASAEQVIVVKYRGGSRDAAIDEIKAYFAEQASIYADYAPAEVPKLEKAVITDRGSYIFAVATADTEGASAAIDAVCGTN